jgi:hypothetical protein
MQQWQRRFRLFVMKIMKVHAGGPLNSEASHNLLRLRRCSGAMVCPIVAFVYE